MEPRAYQLSLAKEGYEILRENMLVYLACEERTGKTLTSILIAEKCAVDNILVLTKKKALDGWHETLKEFKHYKHYTVTNYHQAKKQAKPGLLILDEAHNYIASSPKPSTIHNWVSALSKDIPIIYLSATPHAQGLHMLYHQFSLSSWSPFSRYDSFYHWFQVYGIPNSIWVNSREVQQYNMTETAIIEAKTKHLFITKTRMELQFKYEPKDKIHYIELSEETKEIYNDILTEKVYLDIEFDSPMKLRTGLHMLEGGGLKNTYPELSKNGNVVMHEDFIVLKNSEKIDYILNTWGDTSSLVIYYQYIVEKLKLNSVFKNATILQGTSNAEGIDLSHIETIVIYSQDFSTARHTQRRARQASLARKSNITIHFLLAEKAISEQVYEIVSVNKQNFVDKVFNRQEL